MLKESREEKGKLQEKVAPVCVGAEVVPVKNVGCVLITACTWCSPLAMVSELGELLLLLLLYIIHSTEHAQIHRLLLTFF